MAEVKWIKIATDIFDDEKVLLLESMPDGDSMIVVWFKLLCLAGKQNNCGVFIFNDKIAYTDDMLAAIFRRPVKKVKSALDTFEAFGMIERVNGVVTIPNWSKHQSLDALEKKKEYQREFMRRKRSEQKLICESNCESNSDTNNENCESNCETNVSRPRYKKENKNKSINNSGVKTKRFTPPNTTEITTYCSEKGITVDANRFIDYYETQGWKLSNGNKMVDWKAAVRNWARRDKEKPKEKPKNKFNDFQKSDTDYAALENRLANM